jgi:hypothetical protein
LPTNTYEKRSKSERVTKWKTLPLFDLATFQQEFGNATGTYLKPGGRLEATIRSIGTLVTPVAAE